MKNALKVTIALAVFLIALSAVSCSKPENPSIDLSTAVLNASSSATELKIESIREDGEGKLLKDSAGFKSVMDIMAKYTADRTQPRYREVAGKTEEVKIPYVLDYKLTFKMEDGSKLVFDYSYDKIWFTTKDTLYAGLVDTGLMEVLAESVEK